ncbi:carbohydrate ABC transporter permease [Streptobacillus felis]|uniref:Carbohydrate ABC transporter permease n=1 Tax=Streptobacillus felis TaxID=1384509 RepID=A0A7Z0PET1_9FUSO|nr:carbohydrate ABC transporter permease [Streptobacillus felis]NYV27852.1 carbohydrate ABC transporter permease [Streptobacillus felis]
MKISGKLKFTIYFLCTILTVYFLFPFIWMILSSLKGETEVFSYPPKFLPKKFNIDNFIIAWRSQPFYKFALNSIIITILTTMGQVFSGSLAAYGFARFKFKGDKVLFGIMLATMMLPWDVTVIPQYMQFNLFGWIDTLKPLIVPALFGSAYYIYLLRQFLETIPKDFAEAAKIDGANEFQIYSRIYLPIMKPSIILVAVLNMIVVWNDYLGPLVFTNSQSNYTLALGLAAFKGVHSDAIVPTMCISILMCIPPIIVFFFAQKDIIDGISGGVKG